MGEELPKSITFICSNCGKEIESAKLVEDLTLCDDCYYKFQDDFKRVYEALIKSYDKYQRKRIVGIGERDDQ